MFMTSIIRTKRGAWLLGVCKGLEKSNRGNALFWRLVFFAGTFFTLGITILVYLALAVIFPMEKAE